MTTDTCESCGQRLPGDVLILAALEALPRSEVTHTRLQQETGLDRGGVDYWLGVLERRKSIKWKRNGSGRRIPGAVTITGEQ